MRILAIELDDSLHNKPTHQDRDAVVDSAFAAAGLPISRTPALSDYHTTKVRDAIQTHLRS